MRSIHQLLLGTALFLGMVADQATASEHKIPCSPDIIEFERTVLIDIDRCDEEDPGDVTNLSYLAFEEEFKNTYNFLSSALCDLDFKEVLYVTIVEDEGSKEIERGGSLYSLEMVVTIRCRGCDPEDTTLFAAPIMNSGRKLSLGQNYEVTSMVEVLPTTRQLKATKAVSSSHGIPYSKERMYSHSDDYDESSGKGKGGSSSSKKSYGKGGKGKGGSCSSSSKKSSGKGKGKGGSSSSKKSGKKCSDGDDRPMDTCMCDAIDPLFRSPSEEEFRLVYDENIRENNGGGERRLLLCGDVDHVVKVTELEFLDCSDVEESFMTMVTIQFFGERSEVTTAERLELEAAFIQMYNGLQDNRCDLLFRSVSLAGIQMMADPGGELSFMYLFRVEGTCRGQGCSQDLKIFNSSDEGRRFLAAHSSECTCPVFDPESGPPTIAEFEARCFAVVQDLRGLGRIENVAACGNVEELPFDFTPNPTLLPTTDAVIQPTPAPSALPEPLGSQAPSIEGATNAPSTNPSSTPSDVPTIDGSSAPSFEGQTPVPSTAPSTTPSSEPSGSPSVFEGSSAPSIQGQTPAPSTLPSTLPSTEPSSAPSSSPSSVPTIQGSSAPSVLGATGAPTALPSSSPSSLPSSGDVSSAPSTSAAPSVSSAPSSAPSSVPTIPGSSAPSALGATGAPSSSPSVSSAPSGSPSTIPSNVPSATDGDTSSPTTSSSAPSTSESPSIQPSSKPSVSSQPTESPSTQPSSKPSVSSQPTLSSKPSSSPSISHQPSTSTAPSGSPTSSASESPSAATDPPTSVPSLAPSSSPTVSNAPTASAKPSASPSVSMQPTTSEAPSGTPSTGPSLAPSTNPSGEPSTSPSNSPSETTA